MLAKTISLIAAATCFLSATVNSHMVITSPVPYGQNSLTNSPLINDGSDFPCKQRSGVYDITSMNHMVVGEPQTLAFKGGATHGGGSCQVSVSLDKNPTKDSQWKVIHSIVGGCPTNSSGNIGESADGTGAAVFHFIMPKGMPNGQYSLAWTWFNKIGNREMYMNCAPIAVTGGADDNKVFDSLPDMFVINIPNEECANVEGEDFDFASPGPAAETPFSTALGSKTVGSGCASVTIKGRGTGKAGPVASATDAPTSAASSGSAATTSAAVVSQTMPTSGGLGPVTVTTMATVTGGNAPAPTGAAPSDASASSAVQSSSALAPEPSAGSTGSNPSSSGSCPSGAVSCSGSGSVVCIGRGQFGLCNNNCAVPQALADGTSCSGGTISKMRRVRRAKRHTGESRWAFGGW